MKNLIFAFINLHDVKIDIPSWNGLFGDNILDSIKLFLTTIYSLFSNMTLAVENFYVTLKEINSYVLDLGNSIQTGNVSGIPLLEIIGAYRYLVTDPIFYLTYISILSGCLFTIYKLTMLLIQSFRMYTIKLSDGKGISSSGVFNALKQFFKG